MKKLLLLITVGLLTLGSSSCYKYRLRGEGPYLSETRIVGDFSKIEANGSTDVTVVHDKNYSVIVSGYHNLVPVFETRVNGDRLILQFKDRFWNIRNDNITVEVHTPYLDKISLNGSGSVSTGAGFEQDNFEGNINGSGNIHMSGSTYKTLTADVNGSGDFNSEFCESDNVYAKISGSGNIYVKANNYLKVNISGSGDVYYRGNPAKTDVDISGSGKVHQRN